MTLPFRRVTAGLRGGAKRVAGIAELAAWLLLVNGAPGHGRFCPSLERLLAVGGLCSGPAGSFETAWLCECRWLLALASRRISDRDSEVYDARLWASPSESESGVAVLLVGDPVPLRQAHWHTMTFRAPAGGARLAGGSDATGFGEDGAGSLHAATTRCHSVCGSISGSVLV
jgi:hypothetical protein